ncbi:MAG TPA: hypothetical protein VMW36_11480 [Patescibacteria group bacterium]|nr:hypothetical protein [Patescibacteria group bacterium]
MPKIDIHSQTWKAVEEYAAKQLAEYRQMRELPNKDLREYDQYLGYVRAYKAILKLPVSQQEHKPEAGSVSFGIASLPKRN